MNEPKFVTEDVPLFDAIINDLFPGIDQPEKDMGALQDAITRSLLSKGLQTHDYIISKAIQLYQTMGTRHGVMVVGNTGSGKTTTWSTLQSALTELAETDPKAGDYERVRDYVINPKAVTNDELYGNYDKGRDWKNGIFSVLMKRACSDTSPDLKVVCHECPKSSS